MFKRAKVPLVVFSGMDGAGKTTHIHRVIASWQQLGRRPVYVWSRGGYTPGMERLKRFLRSGVATPLVPPPGPSVARDRAFSRRWIRRWWLRLAIADLIWLYGVAIRWWRWRGRPVLCDRYLKDTQLDFRLNFSHESIDRWWLWRLLCRLTPQPDHQLLLMISPEESQRRSAQKREPFPDAPEMLRARWEEYQRWSTQPAWHVLDGHASQESVASEILQRLGLDQHAAVHVST